MEEMEKALLCSSPGKLCIELAVSLNGTPSIVSIATAWHGNFYSAKTGGVMLSFVRSFCHFVCEQDNSRSRQRTSTKHGRHRQGMTL